MAEDENGREKIVSTIDLLNNERTIKNRVRLKDTKQKDIGMAIEKVERTTRSSDTGLTTTVEVERIALDCGHFINDPSEIFGKTVTGKLVCKQCAVLCRRCGRLHTWSDRIFQDEEERRYCRTCASIIRAMNLLPFTNKANLTLSKPIKSAEGENKKWNGQNSNPYSPVSQKDR